MHHQHLDEYLDVVILVSAKDEKLANLLYNKIIDTVIDGIHPKNVYKDFSNVLENINGFLASWKTGDTVKWLHAIIGVYDKKTFLFSTIGKASCYLYNTHQDLIEATDKNDTPKDFWFISSGDVADGESIIMSNTRLLDILSKDDIKDGFWFDDIRKAGKNMEHILLREHSGKNIWVMTLQQELDTLEEKNTLDTLSYYFYKTFDNRFTKEFLSYIYHLRDTVFHQSQHAKKIFFGAGVLISSILLFWIVSGVFYFAGNTKDTQTAQNELLQAQTYIMQAGENLSNPDMFTLNMEQADEIITSLESQQLFLNDVAKLKDDASVLEKQFNGISPYEATGQNTLYTFPESQNVVKVVSVGNKVYIVHESSITWPILQWENPETYEFEEMAENDSFIDAATSDTNIVLITQEGKVVNFAKNNFYNYVDVIDQPTWEHSKIIDSYNTSLYLLSDGANQIFRHKKNGVRYDSGVPYLRDEDASSIGEILSIAIDGGIYILKSDGSLVKLFRSPEYRLESILLNTLPQNYDFTKIEGKTPSIRARANLKYVYMLIDNKIYVFNPNSHRYQDVKSITYLGQIEGKNMVIEDMYVDTDGEIIAAGKQWVYKIIFEIIDDKVVLK